MMMSMAVEFGTLFLLEEGPFGGSAPDRLYMLYLLHDYRKFLKRSREIDTCNEKNRLTGLRRL